MAKKVRRVKKKNRSTPAAESTAENLAEPVAAVEEKVLSAKEKSAESFRQEYTYVVKDMRSLLLLSGALFVLLIVLNLLLR